MINVISHKKIQEINFNYRSNFPKASRKTKMTTFQALVFGYTIEL